MSVSFITWYPSCRRSDALAKALGGVSHLVHKLDYKQPFSAPLRYLLNTWTTLLRLWRDKPQLILVASPPVFGVLPVWFYTRLLKLPYIIDAHTGVFDDPRWTWLQALSRFLSRQAVATIVTNVFLQQQVESWGAEAIVIGDVPIDFQMGRPAELGPGFHVVVVNTFSQDEPLDEILLAAEKCPEIRFHITGEPRHARITWSDATAAHVQFTGWLADEDYVALLRGADAVMSLTTHDHTMQRGGYEAMALERPLITSDWPVLRETFSAGTIHVDNSADAIVEAITRARMEQPQLAAAMGNLRRARLTVFEESLRALQARLADESVIP